MTKRALFCLLQLLLGGLLSGCLASLQPARTLPNGAYRIHAGVEYFADSFSAAGNATGSSSIDTKTRTTLNVGFRLGVDDRVDLGFQLSLPTLSFDFPHLLFDLKYMFVRSGGFALSAGAGVGYLNAKVTTGRASALDFTGNLNLGYDFGEAFGTFLTIHSITPVVLSTGGTTSISTGTLGTATLGLRIGDTFGLLVGGTYALSLSSQSDTFLIGAALFVGGRSYFGPGLETNGRIERWRERQIQRRPKERIAGRTRPTNGVSRVLKVRESDNLALLSHPESGNWKVGERVCLSSGTKSVTCGVVTKSDPTGAVLKYAAPTGKVTLEMDATSEDPSGLGNRPSDSDSEMELDGSSTVPDEPNSDPAAEDNSDLNDPALGLP